MLHPDVMPPNQRDILRVVGPIARSLGFYLGGGTSVALQIGHRRSIDLDWFREEPIAVPLRLAEQLSGSGIDLEVRYPLLHPPVEWPEYGCQLASPDDLACMKLSAIAGRGAKKDFIDIYALNATGLELDRVLLLYQKRFHVRDVGHIIISLTYFDDADQEDMPEMIWDVGWDEIKHTIERMVIDYTG